MSRPRRVIDLEAFILDLDGCVWRGNAPIQGAPEAIAGLRALGRKVLFLTNNASKTPGEVAARLRGMGIEASEQDILTSATATAEYLLMNFGRVRVFPVGDPGLPDALEKAGHELLGVEEADEAEFVVVAIDRGLTYQKLNAAYRAITGGAAFIATNTDPTLITEESLIVGAGAIVAALSAATGIEPLVIGKPSKYMMEIALRMLASEPGSAVAVGDRLDTDVQAGREAGLFTVLVLTGSTRKEDAEKVEDPRRRPDLVIPDITYLLKALI